MFLKLITPYKQINKQTKRSFQTLESFYKKKNENIFDTCYNTIGRVLKSSLSLPVSYQLNTNKQTTNKTLREQILNLGLDATKFKM